MTRSVYTNNDPECISELNRLQTLELWTIADQECVLTGVCANQECVLTGVCAKQECVLTRSVY